MCKKCRNNHLKTIAAEIEEEVYPLTQQPMHRPQIPYGRVALCTASVLMTVGFLTWLVLAVISQYHTVEMSYGAQFVLFYIVFLLIAMLIFAKHIVIFFIRLYQRYMPYDIRCNCLFVPNCSEYMVLAIKKYGVYKGVRKGINRLLRCHEPNGGQDYP